METSIQTIVILLALVIAFFPIFLFIKSKKIDKLKKIQNIEFKKFINDEPNRYEDAVDEYVTAMQSF